MKKAGPVYKDGELNHFEIPNAIVSQQIDDALIRTIGKKNLPATYDEYGELVPDYELIEWETQDGDTCNLKCAVVKPKGLPVVTLHI